MTGNASSGQNKLARSQINQLANVAESKPPKPPKDLCKDGKAIWKQTLDQLHHVALSEADQGSIRVYVDSVLAYRKAVAFCEANGTTYECNGKYYLRPEAEQIKTNRAVMERFYKNFGCSPASRSTSKLPQPEKIDSKWNQ